MARPRLAFFPSDFAKYPPQVDANGNEGESSRSIKIVVDVTGGGATDQIDLGDLLSVAILTNVQSVKIDNADGANAVTVQSIVTADRIMVPAGYQYEGPFEFTINDNKLNVTRSDAGTLTIWLFNTPRPLACYPASAGEVDIVNFNRAATATRSSVAGAAADTLLLAANTSRKGASVFNDSTATLYLALGTTAATTSNYTAQLLPQSFYELPWPIFTGQIRGIWSAANGNARVTELT